MICPVYFNFNLSISFQMALDEVLYEDLKRQGGMAFLRFYTADQPCYSAGYFIKGFIPADDAVVVRRITGGGLVTHGQDLIFSLGASRKASPFFDSTRESYMYIHSIIQKTFLKSGISPEFATCAAFPSQVGRSDVCFENPVPGDLILDSQKIAGGAQKRNREHFLHQGSLKMSFAGHRFDAAIFSEDLLEAFRQVLGLDFRIEELSHSVLERARALAQTKYSPLKESSLWAASQK
jgi:lipoate-protein ligase A